MELVTTSTELSKGLFLELKDRSWHLRRKDAKRKLPGQPRVRLDSVECLPYFRREHLTEHLDKLIPYVRLLGLATPTHTHISPLHHQAARQRTVIVAETPHLHLVWCHDHIYIKPLPEYMLSSSFWEFLRKTDLELWRACAGYMRTYYYLIQYQIDFKKATSDELGLIPAAVEGTPIEFDRFMEFIEPFALLSTDQVCPRFTFGELRLTRLNTLARIFLWKATYHHEHAQWSTYFGKVLAPFIVLFGVLSTALNAMQVGLAAHDMSEWSVFSGTSWWFAVIVMLFVLITIAIYIILMILMSVTDFLFAKRMEYKKKQVKTQQKIGEFKSGVV